MYKQAGKRSSRRRDDGRIQRIKQLTPSPRTRIATGLAPRPPLDTPFVAPRDDVEARVARIWEEVLRVGPLGADDDFFDLGGESLQAFAMISRLRETLGVALTVRDMFTTATIGGVASLVREGAPPR